MLRVSFWSTLLLCDLFLPECSWLLNVKSREWTFRFDINGQARKTTNIYDWSTDVLPLKLILAVLNVICSRFCMLELIIAIKCATNTNYHLGNIAFKLSCISNIHLLLIIIIFQHKETNAQSLQHVLQYAGFI